MFSKFFINRPIFAAVISIAIVIAGSITIPLLPIEQTPDITPPTVQVSTTYPGASAEVVADTVATPLEEQINGVDNMIYMYSTSSDDGSMNLTVAFEVGTDVDMSTVLVQNRVNMAEPTLPEEVKRQGITTQKQSTNIVLVVNLISPGEEYDEIYLSNYINIFIKDVLLRVHGVGDVNVFGAKDYGMRIWLNPDLVRSRGLTTEDVVNAIREQNVQVAAGQIGAPPSPKDQQFQYTVNTLGRLTTVEEFENIILKVGKDGRLVRVKDVARVELGAQSYTSYCQLDGAPSIAMGVYQLPGANAIAVAQGVKEAMDELAKSFPKGVEYRIAFDTTKFVHASIKEVIQTLFIAIILVILTVYIFLQDFRTTLIPAITIPVSLIGTFAVMMAVGLSINTLSLFGLLLAIGIVVDDAIVVVENTTRIINEEGLPAKEAALKSMEQITGPVVATTLVLLAVFVPTAMTGGITGRLYQQFALTISISTVFSSINALTMSPALCGLLLRPSKGRHGWFFNLFNKYFDRTTKGYHRAVSLVVHRTAVMMLIFAGLGVLMFFGFKTVPGGFIPDEDQGYVFISVRLPDGATLERTRVILDRINGALGNTPGVADYITIGGYSILDNMNSTNTGSYFVTLTPWDDRKSKALQVWGVLENLNAQLSQIEDAICFAFGPPAIMGLGNASGFDFRLEDRADLGLVMLQEVAEDLVFNGNNDPVLTRMNNSFRATVPQIYLDIDRTKVKTLGIPLSMVFDTLQVYLGSLYVNDFNLFGRVYKVMAQADSEFRSRVETIGQLQVRDKEGKMAPLATLLTVQETAGPQAVFHYNLYTSAPLTGEPRAGYSSGQAMNAMAALAKRLLPPGMGYDWSGISYQQIKAGAQTVFIFGLAIVFVYLFLSAQYESWSIPLAVMLSIPLALFGAILFTLLRSYDNNIYTQIGLVLLIGMASKSAILIVEFAKTRREEGESIIEAAVEASRLRFRAILMTAFSFILGVMPLVIAVGAGAVSRRNLGTAVFGGMLAATVFGVIFIPVLYVVVQKTAEKLGGKGKEAPGKILQSSPDEDTKER